MKKRQARCTEGPVCVIRDIKPEPLSSILEEISISRRTLRIEFKVLNLTVIEKDHLYILSPHIYDYICIIEITEGGLGVGYCLDKGYVSAETLLKHILCVSCSTHPGHLKVSAS